MNNQQNPRNMVLGQFMNGMMGIKRPQQLPQGGMMGGMQDQMMGFRPAQKMRNPMPNMAGMTNQQRIARMLMGYR